VHRPDALKLPLEAAGGPPNPAFAGNTSREVRRERLIDRSAEFGKLHYEESVLLFFCYSLGLQFLMLLSETTTYY